MLAVGGGALWLLSTPNGREGFFYEAWISERDWTRIEAKAEECPRIPAAFLEEERETLGEDTFLQKYGCEFVCGEGTLFDEAEIRARLTDRIPPLW